MKNKKSIIYFTIGTIVLILLILAGYFILSKSSIFSPSYNKKNILSSLVGDYGKCTGSRSCTGVEFDKTGNEYTYTSYIYWSDGIRSGKIKSVTPVGENKYELSIYYPATTSDTIYGEMPEKTEVITVDTSKLSSNIINVQDMEYEKIIGDREEFYNTKGNEQQANILSSLVGDYGKCTGIYSCTGVEFDKNDNEYIYTSYKYWSDGIRSGKIKSVAPVGENKYELSIYYPATTYDTIYGETPEKTEVITVDTSKLSSNIINVQEMEYEKIIGDREEFYNSKNDQNSKKGN